MESDNPPPGPTREEEIAALVKYNSTVFNIISTLKDSLDKEGIEKVSENLSLFYPIYAALTNLCVSFKCISVPQLEKKLEVLASQYKSNDEVQDHIEGYFRAYTEWKNILQHCDKLFEKGSNERLESTELFQSNVMDYQLDSLEEFSLEKVRLGDILSTEPRTWLVFLRHYS